MLLHDICAPHESNVSKRTIYKTNFKKKFISGTIGIALALFSTKLIVKEMPAFHKTLHNRYNFQIKTFIMSFKMFVEILKNLFRKSEKTIPIFFYFARLR